jgi:hypothetical protein
MKRSIAWFRRVTPAALPALLACAFLGGCAGYQLAGRGADAREPAGTYVPRPHRLGGDEVDFKASGCPLAPEPMVYVFDVLIDSDGTAEVVNLLRGTPTDCIRSYVERKVSTWRFEPPTMNGQPTQLRYSIAFSAPASTGD